MKKLLARISVDQLLGLGLIAFCIIFYFVIIPWQIYQPARLHGPLSPRYFPRLITLFLLFVGVLLTSGITIKRGAKEIKEPEFMKDTVQIIAVFIVYYYLIGLLGWFTSSVTTLAFMTFLYGSRSWKITLFLSAALPLVLYLFFEKIAHVMLPRGFLF